MWCCDTGHFGSKDYSAVNLMVVQSKKNRYSVILWNLSRKCLPKDTALYPRRLESSRTLLWEPQIINCLHYSSAVLKNLTMKPLYRVFQKDLNSGHRGHRTWHPVIFSYGDMLKTMPTNHHSHKMCVNCKIAFELRCKPLMGTCWSASGRS